MSNRNHEALIIDDFLGLYSRGEGDALPQGYLNDFNEFRFHPSFGIRGSGGGKISTRNPIASVLSWTGAFTPRRFFWYSKSSGGRFIYLNTATGDIRDQTAGTIILTVAGTQDFSGITVNDRFYFSLHNREIGTSGQNLYVYDPAISAVARPAAGRAPINPPDGAFTVAAGAAGNTEPGQHVLAVAYETNTGFVTKPGTFIGFVSGAPRASISITNLPIGPAGTVARHILMSKKILNYDGNPQGYELFQALKVNDNVTLAIANAINLYDTQLIDSKEYLKDQLESIPGGLQLCSFNGRLVTCGENADGTLVRVSKSGEPESFSALDGFIKCYKGMGLGPVRNVKSTHGVLYMWKRYSTFTARDNGNAPSSWQVDQIDAGLGAEVFSVAEVWDSVDGSFQGGFFVANYNGFYFLNGTIYSDSLAYNIQADWSDVVDLGTLNNLGSVFDSFNRCAYVNTTDFLYLFDLNRGIAQPRVSRWLTGVGGVYTIHLFIGSADLKPILLFQATSGSTLQKIDLSTSSASNLEANSGATLQIVLADPEYRNMHLGVLKFMGNGIVSGEVTGFSGSIPITLNYNMVFVASRLSRHEINIASPVIQISFVDFDGTSFNLEKVIAYLAPEAEEWPY